MSGRRWQELDLQTLDKGLDCPDRDDDQYHRLDDKHRAIGDCNEPFMHGWHLGTSSNQWYRSTGQHRTAASKSLAPNGLASHALLCPVSRSAPSSMPGAKRSV